MKTAFFFVVFLAATLPVYGDDETTLIYPMKAADTELDNSTPAKRITPPVREDTEYDPVTPIGQIRGVLEDLEAVKTQNASILERLNKLGTADNRELLGFFEKSSKASDEISGNVNDLILSTKNVGAKLDALQKTTENLRATVEAAQKTAASVEKIRTSRWTDYAVIAILALVLIQLIWRVGGAISSGVKARAEQFRELAAAYELAKKQLAQKEKE